MTGGRDSVSAYANSCGSELAREEALTSNINIDCHTFPEQTRQCLAHKTPKFNEPHPPYPPN